MNIVHEQRLCTFANLPTLQVESVPRSPLPDRLDASYQIKNESFKRLLVGFTELPLKSQTFCIKIVFINEIIW